MTAAYEVLKRSLEDDFGFEHILWVFSGRRGIHAWVCDERARIMDNVVRGGMTGFLNIAVSNERMDTLVIPKVHSNPEFPLFVKSYQILEPKFEQFMIREQAFLAFPKHLNKTLGILERILKADNQLENFRASFERLCKELTKELQDQLPSFSFKPDGTRNPFGPQATEEADFSQQTYSRIKKFLKDNGLGKSEVMFMKEIVIGLMYPKIDSHVSAQTNHLLKCPFNVHSSTGMISVPIDDFDNFSLDDVPYVQEVIQAQRSGEDKLEARFGRFMAYFNGFCDKMLKDIQDVHIMQKKMAAETEPGRMEEEGLAF
jgi:DNA primase small subunit